MSKHKKKRGVPFGCLFWVLFLLLIAAIFILNKDTIALVLEKTEAKSMFFTPETAAEKSGDSENLAKIEVKKVSSEQHAKSGDGSGESSHASETVVETPAKKLQSVSKPQSGSKQVEQQPIPQSVSKPEKQPPKKTVQQPQRNPVQKPADSVKKDSAKTRNVAVFFVSIDTDGKITRHSIQKILEKSDSPMSDALTVLFAAPTGNELKKGLRTLIPVGTKLRSAWVKDGVAFINVSDEFQYNQYGIDGYLAQLAQVVFTATEFSTVQTVQILIEGQKKEYLGAEGVWIGTPLSRASF